MPRFEYRNPVPLDKTALPAPFIILGFHDIDALTRTVRWDRRLDVTHGIRRLRFGDVAADIVYDPVDGITVDSSGPFTLEVNGETFEVGVGRTVVGGDGHAKTQ